MSSDPADSWLLTAFADTRHGVWGLLLGGAQPRAVIRTIGSLDGAPPDTWNPAAGLALSPGGDGAGSVSATEGAARGLQALRVSDAQTPEDGEPLEVDAPAFGFAGPGLPKLDSVRILAAWFPSQRTVALAAVRPREGRSDAEMVSVLVTGEPEPLTVFDPRLSTTYDGDGKPVRAGLELWLGEEDGDHHPLRLSSESNGDQLSADLDDLRLQAFSQRCHAWGEDGVGLYALLRPR